MLLIAWPWYCVRFLLATASFVIYSSSTTCCNWIEYFTFSDKVHFELGKVLFNMLRIQFWSDTDYVTYHVGFLIRSGSVIKVGRMESGVKWQGKGKETAVFTLPILLPNKHSTYRFRRLYTQAEKICHSRQTWRQRWPVPMPLRFKLSSQIHNNNKWLPKVNQIIGRQIACLKERLIKTAHKTLAREIT